MTFAIARTEGGHMKGIACFLSCLALAAGAFAGEGIDVSYKSGDETVHGMLYAPSGTGPFPTLIAIHGAGGLNDDVKQRASRLAAEGYLTLAVDLFRGQVPGDLAHA